MRDWGSGFFPPCVHVGSASSKSEPVSHFHRALFPVPPNWNTCSSKRACLLQLFVALVTDSCHRDRKHGLHFWHANISPELRSRFAWNRLCSCLAWARLLSFVEIIFFYHSCVKGKLLCLTQWDFLVLYLVWIWCVGTSSAELVLGNCMNNCSPDMTHDGPLTQYCCIP